MAKRPPQGSSSSDAKAAQDAKENVAVDAEAPLAPPVEAVEPVTAVEPLRPDPEAVPPTDATAAEGTPDLDPPPPQDMQQADQMPPDVKPTSGAPVANKPSQGSGFLGTALGGVVAAAAGYALAVFVPFPGVGGSDAPAYAERSDLLVVTARIEALETAPAADSSLSERVAALEAALDQATAQQDVAPLVDQLSALGARLDALEQRGPDSSGAQVPADLAAELDALRAEVSQMRETGADASASIEALAAQAQDRLAEAEAQAEALRAEAEETARRARAAAALGRVQAALESGAPYASALADLPAADVPGILASQADTGVPSLAALGDMFPPAARAALEASLRANMGEGWSDRLSSFLQATTGARSLTPREGTDPDAVLSRAEAAVGAGQIEQAISELQGLPPEGLAAMADWLALAQQRLDAIAAVTGLAAALEG